ncbi:MAG: hypothetical protein U0169_04785 [Polyangiaceae bacterium]
MSRRHLVAAVAFALVAGCSKSSTPTSSSADAMPAVMAPATAPSASSRTPAR